MPVTINGTTGVVSPDGSASTPSYQGSDSNTGMFFPAADTIAFSTAGTEDMRITSTGDVGIGTSSLSNGVRTVIQGSQTGGAPQTSGTAQTFGVLRLQGTSFTSVLDFGTNGGNYNWIQATDSSNLATNYNLALQPNGGNLLVGTTGVLNGNTSYNFQNNSTSLNTAWFQNANASAGASILVATAARTASNGFNFLDCGANFPTSYSRQFLVRGDGVVFAQNTTIQSLSDARVKENVRNSDEGLTVVNALRTVRFDFKPGFGNDRKNQLGFVAQEVEAVFPDAVSEWEQDGEAYKSVGPGALIPVLVKAIQELTARVQALESKA